VADQNVNIKITADGRQATSTIDGVKNMLSELGVQGGPAGKVLDGLSGKLGAIALAGAGVAAAFVGGKWIAGLVSGAMDAADRLGELGQAAGVSGSTLSEYQLAVANAGSSIEGFGKALGRINVQVGEALSGNKEASAAFSSLGFSLSKLQSLQPDEIFKRIADRTVEAGGAAKVAADLNAIMGRSWQELAPLLSQGGQALADAANQAQALGLALSDDVIAQADQTTDALAAVGSIATGFANKVMAEVAPTLKGLADRFVDLVVQSGALDIAARTVAAAFNVIVNAGQIVSATLSVVSTWVGGLGRALMNLAQGEFRAAYQAITETATSAGATIQQGVSDIRAVWDGTLGTFKAAAGATDDLNTKTDRLAKGTKAAGKEAAAAAREQERLGKAYAETVGGIDERIAALQREASGAAELTEADKLQLAVLKQLRDGKLRVTEAQWAEITAKLELLGTLSAERAATEAAKKADEEHLKVRLSWIDAEWKAAAAIDEQVRRQLEENEAIGLTAQQLAELEIRRLNDSRAMLEQRAQAIGMHADALGEIAGINAQIAAIDRLIEARRAGAARQGEVDAGEAAKRAAVEMQAEVQRSADSMRWSITDALMRGFESGKAAAENFVDTVKNLGRTLVIRPLIEAVVSPITLGAAGLLGASSAAQAAGGASAASGLTSVGSLFGAGGLAGSFGAGAGWLTGATTLTGSLGAAGSLMGTGTLAGFTSGLGMAAGALGPIALGAMLVSSFLKDRGGPKTGGSFTSDPALERLYTPSDQDVLAAQLGQSAAQTYAQLIQGYGGAPSALSYGIGFDMDPKGTAQSRSSFFVGESGTVTTEIGSSDEEMRAGVALAVQRMVVAGLQQSDLPQAFAGVFDSLDVATATAEQINGAIAAGEAVRGLLDAISMLGVPVDTVTASMIAAGGGAERLTQSLGSYVANFYSDAERQTVGMRGLQEQFAALGVAMPATREQFRATVEALYESGPAGRETAAAMVGLSDAFAALVPATEGVEQAVQKLLATQAEVEGYWKAVLSPTEYAARELDRLRASFEELGTPMPATIDGFRALVEGMDTSSDAGRSLQIQLGLLAQDFVRLVDAPKAAGAALGELGDAIGEAAEQARDALADFTAIYSARKGLYTQEQLIGQSSGFLAEQFAELGQTMPAAREQFIALLDAAAGTDTEAKLQSLLPLWLEMIGMQEDAAAAAQRTAQEASRAANAQREAARQAAKAAIDEAQRSAKAIQDAMRGIGQFVQGLFTSGDLLGLTPEQQFSAAQSAFEAASQQALGGDLGAIRDVQTLARDTLAAAEAMWAHSEGFIAVRDSVIGRLTQISGQSIPDTTRTYDAGAQVTGAAPAAMDVEAYREQTLQTGELVAIRRLLTSIDSDGRLARSRD